ncbi:restriction endonuclease subunit S [Providencia rettgeri]
MVGRYKAYPEYKNTDIKFLKNIPTHWVTSKVKYISSFGRGLSITKADLQDSGVPCVSYGEVHSMFGFEVDPKRHLLKCVNEEYLKTSSYALLSKGDFVFADTSEDIDGSGNFTQLISDEKVFAGYHTVIVRPNLKNHYRFIAYLFDSAEFRIQIQDAVKGVKVFSITQAILKSADVWFPSYEEQQKIANFLDHEIAKIDTLIAKQEKLIELLKEKRQAVISHVVTKGLNPDVSMKDSGVEWLGEVPEHWVVSKLKFESEIIDCRNKTPEYHSEGEYFVVRTTNVKNQQLNFNGALYTDEKNFKIWTQRGIPPVGSILFTREAPTGEVCRVPNNLKFCMGQRMMNFIAKDKMYADYLFDYLISDCLERYIGSVSHGSTVSHLRVEQVENIPVLVPSRDEIISIHNEISKLKLSYDALVSKVASTIELLKERKTALISAAVTGKIDVRDWQELIEKQG